VVLTGGIASGKTAVSNHFARLGVPVIDTDRIAHEMVEPGQPALQRIAEIFGPEFLDVSGRLDRRKMRQAIFANAELKARLESILHPLIAAEALRRINALDSPYCILVIPLYTESARWPFIDRVLVVDAEEATQIERVMARDGIDHAQAEAILRAQAGRQERLALADDVIDNSGSLEDLQKQVEALHQTYLDLAKD
jgi:dephospho-CoA kinase